MLETTTTPSARRQRPWHVFMPDEARPADQAACRRRRAAFAAKYGVRRAEWVLRDGVLVRRTRSPHIRSVIRSGGADIQTRRAAIDLMFGPTLDGVWIDRINGDNHILDHVESWGRGGRSLFLVAHPYGYSDATRFTCDDEPRIRRDAREFLRGVAMAGLSAWLAPPGVGWHGYGSHQIVICNPDAVERALGVSYEPVGYRMPVPPADDEPCRWCGEPWGMENGDLVWLSGGPGRETPTFAPACEDCAHDNWTRERIPGT